MSTTEIKKYGADEISDLTVDELKAQIEYLNHNLDIAKKTLEFIIIESPSTEDCIKLSETTLYYMSLRKWRK
jgi:hypothetical protein